MMMLLFPLKPLIFVSFLSLINSIHLLSFLTTTMKFTGAFLFSILAFAAGSDAKLFGKDKPAYEDWSLDQSLAFLKEQGIKVRDSPTLEEVRKQVLANADKAATVSSFWLNVMTSEGQ
jgi:hypothetical protein